MEYLLGSITTLIAVVVINKLIKKESKDQVLKLNRSQSYLYKLLAEISQKEFDKKKQERQSDKYLSRQSVKVMILDDKAYWIKDNRLYVANYFEGNIDNYSIEEVDTISMDQVELKKTIFIVEKLSEEE